VTEGFAAATNPNRDLRWGGLASQGKGLADLVGKLWALPNTAVGLSAGLAGLPFGATLSLR